ncbi:MAG: glycoside hydrolase family 1 protein [Candidatus Omnitrophota bacterium]|jgi:beta-glucosidase
MIKFPSNFLWGAATSAYQVEGNNTHSDWWHWEKKTGKENSGPACRHYELYEQDFDLAQTLHHNAHRLSIEWSRIEPEEGKFSREELTHYRNVILALRARSIEPMVTMHHFTNPAWFSASIGWDNKRAGFYFLRYCDFVVSALAKHVRYWIPINEPTIYISHAYILGVWPPQEKSYPKAKTVADNLASAHVKAFRLIHAIYKESGLPQPSVGIAQHMQAFIPCTTSIKNRLAAYLRNKWYNFGIIDKLTRQGTLDFIGINYYSRQLVELKKWGINNLARDICNHNHHPVKKNSLSWDIYPEGLYELLLKLKKYSLPVIITENGICTEDDNLRWEYISAHLKNIHRALENGVPVAGYLYWSLIDNFEWDKGFPPRFGLIDIDYADYKRTIRDSAVKFSRVCKTGILE